MEVNEVMIMDAGAPDTLPEKRCYTVEDLQAILGISRPSVYNLIGQNLFRRVKVGGKYRISKKSFDTWLDQQF